jgi:hypothetical protein
MWEQSIKNYISLTEPLQGEGWVASHSRSRFLDTVQRETTHTQVSNNVMTLSSVPGLASSGVTYILRCGGYDPSALLLHTQTHQETGHYVGSVACLGLI